MRNNVWFGITGALLGLMGSVHQSSHAASPALGAQGVIMATRTSELAIRANMSPGDRLWQARQTLWRGGSRQMIARHPTIAKDPAAAVEASEKAGPTAPKRHAHLD